MQAQTQTQIQPIIEEAYARLGANDAKISKSNAELVDSVNEAIAALQSGTLRVAEKQANGWQVNQWLKKAVLLYFALNDNRLIHSGSELCYYDKVATQFSNYTATDFAVKNIRVVPPAVARVGAYLAKNTVLMPSYVNIGAYVDQGTMVDTWATVGSCAQIGKNVHLSGGVGIGGVLEPLQANPTIIEDNCFIGARSEIVEGVIVEQDSVISMGVFLGQSTKIYNRLTDEVTYGVVPKGSVVVPGSLPSANGRANLNCAVIIKQVDAKTRAKVGINQLLRDS